MIAETSPYIPCHEVDESVAQVEAQFGGMIGQSCAVARKSPDYRLHTHLAIAPQRELHKAFPISVDGDKAVADQLQLAYATFWQLREPPVQLEHFGSLYPQQGPLEQYEHRPAALMHDFSEVLVRALLISTKQNATELG